MADKNLTPREYYELAETEVDPVWKVRYLKAAKMAENEMIAAQGAEDLYQGTRNPIVQAAEDVTSKALGWAPMLIPGPAGMGVMALDTLAGHPLQKTFNWAVGRPTADTDVGHELGVQAAFTVPSVLRSLGMGNAAAVASGLAGVFGGKVIKDAYDVAKEDVNAAKIDPTTGNIIGQMFTPGVQGTTQGGDLINLGVNAHLMGAGAGTVAGRGYRKVVNPEGIRVENADRATRGLPFIGDAQKPGVLRPGSFYAEAQNLNAVDTRNMVSQEGPMGERRVMAEQAVRQGTEETPGEGNFARVVEGSPEIKLWTERLYNLWASGKEVPLEGGAVLRTKGVPWQTFKKSALRHELEHGRMGADEVAAAQAQFDFIESKGKEKILADPNKPSELAPYNPREEALGPQEMFGPPEAFGPPAPNTSMNRLRSQKRGLQKATDPNKLKEIRDLAGRMDFERAMTPETDFATEAGAVSPLDPIFTKKSKKKDLTFDEFNAEMDLAAKKNPPAPVQAPAMDLAAEAPATDPFNGAIKSSKTPVHSHKAAIIALATNGLKGDENVAERKKARQLTLNTVHSLRAAKPASTEDAIEMLRKEGYPDEAVSLIMQAHKYGDDAFGMTPKEYNEKAVELVAALETGTLKTQQTNGYLGWLSKNQSKIGDALDRNPELADRVENFPRQKQKQSFMSLGKKKEKKRIWHRIIDGVKTVISPERARKSLEGAKTPEEILAKKERDQAYLDDMEHERALAAAEEPRLREERGIIKDGKSFKNTDTVASRSLRDVEDALSGDGAPISGKDLAEIIRTKFNNSDIGELKAIQNRLLGKYNEVSTPKEGAVYSGDSMTVTSKGTVVAGDTGLREKVASLAEQFDSIDKDFHEPVPLQMRPAGKANDIHRQPNLAAHIKQLLSKGLTVAVPPNSIKGIMDWYQDKGKDGTFTSVEETYPNARFVVWNEKARSPVTFKESNKPFATILKPIVPPSKKAYIAEKGGGSRSTVNDYNVSLYRVIDRNSHAGEMTALPLTAWNKTQNTKARKAIQNVLKTTQKSRQKYIDDVVERFTSEKMDDVDRIKAVQNLTREAGQFYDEATAFIKHSKEVKGKTGYEAYQTFEDIIGNERVSKDTIEQAIERGEVSNDTIKMLEDVGMIVEGEVLRGGKVENGKLVGRKKVMGKKVILNEKSEAVLHVYEIKRALNNGMSEEALGLSVDPETKYISFDNYRGGISTELLRNWNNMAELHEMGRAERRSERELNIDNVGKKVQSQGFERAGLPSPFESREQRKAAGTRDEAGEVIDSDRRPEMASNPRHSTAEAVEGFIGHLMNKFYTRGESIPDGIIEHIENVVPAHKSKLYADLVRVGNAAMHKALNQIKGKLAYVGPLEQRGQHVAALKTKVAKRAQELVMKKLNDPIMSYMSLGEKAKDQDVAWATKALRAIGKFSYYFDASRTFFSEALNEIESSSMKHEGKMGLEWVKSVSGLAREGQAHAIDAAPRQEAVHRIANESRISETLNDLPPESPWFTNANDIMEGRYKGKLSEKDKALHESINDFKSKVSDLFAADSEGMTDLFNRTEMKAIRDWVPAEFLKKYEGSENTLIAAYRHLAGLTEGMDANAIESNPLAESVLNVERNSPEFKKLTEDFLKVRKQLIKANPDVDIKAIDGVLQHSAMQKLRVFNYDTVGRERAEGIIRKSPTAKEDGKARPMLKNFGEAGEQDVRAFLPRYVQMAYKNYPAVPMRNWLVKNVFDRKSPIAQMLIETKQYDKFVKNAEAHLRNEFVSGMSSGANEATWLTSLVKNVYGADLTNQIFPHQAAMEYVKQKMYQNLLTRPAFMVLNSTDILLKTISQMNFPQYVSIVPKMWGRMLKNMVNYKKGNDKLVDFLMDNVAPKGNLLAELAGSGKALPTDTGLVARGMRGVFGEAGGKAYAGLANLWGKASSFVEGQEKANSAGLFGASLEHHLSEINGHNANKKKGHSTFIEAMLAGDLKMSQEQIKAAIREGRLGASKTIGAKAAMMGQTPLTAVINDAFGKNSGMASLWSLSNMFLNYPANMIVRTLEAMKTRANKAEFTYANEKGLTKQAKVAGEAFKPAAMTALMSLLIYGTAAKMQGEDVDSYEKAATLAIREWGINGLMPASMFKDLANIVTGNVSKGLSGFFAKHVPGWHMIFNTAKVGEKIIGGKEK